MFADEPTLDFGLLTKALAERFGGTWELDILPFPVAKTNEELAEKIRTFDEER